MSPSPLSSLSLSLALLTTALALPSSQFISPPPVTEEFSILANVSAPPGFAPRTFNFVAVQNDTSTDSVVLVGQACTSSPLRCNATNPYFFSGDNSDAAALNVDLSHYPGVKTGGVYGLNVPKVGDAAYGVVKTVTGVLDKQDFGWEYDAAGKIGYKGEKAGVEGFWLCSDVVKGNSTVVLKWGRTNRDGSTPKGCNGPASLRKA